VLRLIYCVRRPGNMDKNAFHKHWKGGDLDDPLRALISLLEPDSVAFTLKFNTIEEIDQQIRGFGFEKPYDAIVDFRWNNTGKALAMAKEDGIFRILKIIQDNSPFVDSKNSSVFFTESPSVEIGTLRQL